MFADRLLSAVSNMIRGIRIRSRSKPVPETRCRFIVTRVSHRTIRPYATNIARIFGPLYTWSFSHSATGIFLGCRLVCALGLEPIVFHRRFECQGHRRESDLFDTVDCAPGSIIAHCFSSRLSNLIPTDLWHFQML